MAAYTKDMKFRMDPVDDFSGRHLQEFLDRLNAGWFTEFFFYWVLQGFTGFYWVLPSFKGFYRVLPRYTWFYRVLLGFT